MHSINDRSVSPHVRLEALRAIIRAEKLAPGVPFGAPDGSLKGVSNGLPKVASDSDLRVAPSGSSEPEESNNHIHTCYSFSPYTPTAAALKARQAGLTVAGSVDHDSLEAAQEMIEACHLLGMGSVTGFEIRVYLGDSWGELSRRKLNNPDSTGILYMTVQGVPASARDSVRAFLKPVRERRLERTRKMTEAASSVLAAAGAEPLDFDRDVRGLSCYDQGGSITERHLLAACSTALITSFGTGPEFVLNIQKKLNLHLDEKTRTRLADPDNPYLAYDLLGILKAEFLPSIFIQPSEECLTARQAVEFALGIGAIPAYAYLGDVHESPTGDKKAEKFEDDFLPELFDALKSIGFPAVTYMPPRNTRAQLERVRQMCKHYGFMEISGVDINQPRQSFNCPELRLPEFSHLNTATWAMVAHEALAGLEPSAGLFSPSSRYGSMPLDARLAIYARCGRDMVHNGRDVSAVLAGFEKGRYEA